MMSRKPLDSRDITNIPMRTRQWREMQRVNRTSFEKWLDRHLPLLLTIAVSLIVIGKLALYR